MQNEVNLSSILDVSCFEDLKFSLLSSFEIGMHDAVAGSRVSRVCDFVTHIDKKAFIYLACYI